MSQELAQYLENVLSEGQVHSQGQFTVDFRRSKQLLGGALFAHPANYILKIIQSAILTLPAEVKVRITRDTVQISYSPRHPVPPLEAVEKALKDPLNPDQVPILRNLALGLQAAASQDPLHLMWGYHDINGGEALLLKAADKQTEGESRLVRIPLPSGTASECVFQMKRTPAARSFVQKLLGTSQAGAADTSHITQACQYCTTPIYVDGRLVNLPRFPRLSKEPPLLTWGYNYDVLIERLILSRDPLCTLMLAPPPIERQAAAYDLGYGTQDLALSHSSVLYQWRSFNDNHNQVVGSDGLSTSLFRRQAKPGFKAEGVKLLDRLLVKHPNSVPLGHPDRDDNKAESRPALYHVSDLGDWTRPDYEIAYRLLSNQRPLAGHASLLAPTQPIDERSRLYVVQSGVTLLPLTFESALPGMVVVLADDRLKTDLSGLQVVEDDRLRAVMGWLLSQSEEMKKEARSVIRFGEKLSMNNNQLKELRQRLKIDDPEY